MESRKLVEFRVGSCVILGMDNITTSELFSATNQALIEKRWSLARSLLDDLGRRKDNVDKLSSAVSYGCPSMLLAVIQDRIDLVNSRVD